jgi:rod shape determining protein RodA
MRPLWSNLAIAKNWPVLGAVLLLSLAGYVSIHAHDPAEAQRQLVFMGISIAVLSAVQLVNYREIGRYAWALYIVSVLLLIYTVIGAWYGNRNPNSLAHIPLVPKVKGAYAWIDLGFTRFEPSEITKIAFVMVLARYLRFRSNYRTLAGLVPPFLLALTPVALIMKQPDLGVAATFIPALLAMLFVAGARKSHLVAVVLAGVLLVPLMWFSGMDNVPVLKYGPQLIRDYQRERVYAMLGNDPKTLQEGGYQQQLGLEAFASGGATGRGAGDISIGRHVPEAHNDMVFTLIGEQFGFLGAAVVLGAYIVLFAAGVEIAAATREPFGRLMAIGLVSMIAGQTFLNLMVELKLMPVTGVTLPYISYGGSSLLASYIAAGLLLNIGQHRPLVMARSSFEF